MLAFLLIFVAFLFSLQYFKDETKSDLRGTYDLHAHLTNLSIEGRKINLDIDGSVLRLRAETSKSAKAWGKVLAAYVSNLDQVNPQLSKMQREIPPTSRSPEGTVDMPPKCGRRVYLCTVCTVWLCLLCAYSV